MEPSIKSWAEREIDIACQIESGDYSRVCYLSALKAYKSLMEDGHSNNSMNLTKYVLNRLIDGKPLSPIEDTVDVWDDIIDHTKDYRCYQCNRMSSLFKHVYPDGTIKYLDVDRFRGVLLGDGASYSSNLINRIMNDSYPIKMPYYPHHKSIKVFCEEFLTDERNGDFDTEGILYFMDSDGNRVDVNRYFKDSYDGVIEIDKQEYEARRLMHFKRLEKTLNENV